ncbi:hypothetical protein PRIPAC_95296 [Pristionchus pacificus]|uniref:C2H2-type domain-containing protein n=1 Tax=Pristionchus pacificus TaxID=54126 RepID=A0A2A6CTW0_PRIPA|nr:hypothetical protein PRIPAC_95296 [Pristionchus pacificus]|eukprot:PDM81662.1 hypothetical protein PRIPAC_30643 [Pristionchus pacificus]
MPRARKVPIKGATKLSGKATETKTKGKKSSLFTKACTCKFCKKILSTPGYLRRHYGTIHKDLIQPSPPGGQDIITAISDSIARSIGLSRNGQGAAPYTTESLNDIGCPIPRCPWRGCSIDALGKHAGFKHNGDFRPMTETYDDLASFARYIGEVDGMEKWFVKHIDANSGEYRCPYYPRDGEWACTAYLGYKHERDGSVSVREIHDFSLKLRVPSHLAQLTFWLNNCFDLSGVSDGNATVPSSTITDRHITVIHRQCFSEAYSRVLHRGSKIENKIELEEVTQTLRDALQKVDRKVNGDRKNADEEISIKTEPVEVYTVDDSDPEDEREEEEREEGEEGRRGEGVREEEDERREEDDDSILA